MLVSEEGLEVSGNKQPQSHVASSKEGTFLAHATCPPWFSWDAGEGAAPLQVPARCCQRWTERVSRLSGRGDTWLPAISLVKACHRAAANSGGQGGEPDILGALQATTWCSLFGGLAGLKEGSGDWQEMTAGLSQDGSLSPQPGGVCPQPAQNHHWQDPKE